ncbi:unnamed protein product [Rotaria socialis]|uniref:Uncharacterized protein n=1 Tax=Rotaria socialis TaxID=392032 RepID=A0A817M7B0_9BILA|nr:unnamed protein product [Rotaria socialis]
MSSKEYQILKIVKTLDEADVILKEHNVSKYRTSDLSSSTKYSYRCSNYRKYPLFKIEIQVYVDNNHLTEIKLMYKNVHCHEQRNTTTRAPSPVRELVSNYVQCNLTEVQIKSLLFVNDPTTSMPTNQLSNLINYARRKNNPEIFSVYDFNQWCINHKYEVNGKTHLQLLGKRRGKGRSKRVRTALLS